ncbi:hypothetical protein GCM10022421_09090 [Oceanisphaera sediminis]|uniref:Lambda-like tail fibre protein N-terminal domain-containing protein n=1 Tax=Oceanisphaera sediminis TaxID=981381 RepID=A0ABP7DJ81_9GAMM
MITVSGILKTPGGAVLANTEIKFYAVATASNVLQGTTGLILTGSDGSYSVTLQQGSHRVTVRQGNTRPETIGTVHISVDTTASTLNELLLAASAASPGNPLADEVLAARDRAETAATEAEATRAATEALRDNTQSLRDQTSEISGLSTVAEAIATARLPQPDVFIPFNDSLRIERGYGTHDQIDVSAAQDGSVMVNLPSKSADFSRTSGAESINKFGQLTTQGVDEAGISSQGVDIYNAALAVTKWSEDLNNVSWKSARSTLASLGAITTLNNKLGWKIEGDGTEGTSYIYLPSFTTEDSQVYQVGVFVKAAEKDTFQLGFPVGNGFDGQAFEFNLSTFTAVNLSSTNKGTATLVPLDDDWFWCTAWAECTTGATANWILFSMGLNLPLGSGVQLTGLVVTKGLSPYIKTEDTSGVLRSPDSLRIPIVNNMPAPGRPFTLVLDYSLPLGTSFNLIYMLTVGSLTHPEGCLRLALSQTGALYAGSVNNAHVSIFPTGLETPGMRRLGIAYDGSIVRAYADGVWLGDSDPGAMLYPRSGDIHLGRYSSSGYAMDGSVKALRVYHRTLTSEQMAALGGPQ